ncbi:MAG: sensor domain-containing diguanylate cyclase [Bdellovibrionota bacterium]
MINENEKLREILKIVLMISATNGLNKTLEIIMTRAKELMEAEGSSLMLIDPETNELVFQIIEGEKKTILQGFRLKMGVGIAGLVAATGVSRIVNDVSSSSSHYKGVDAKSNFVTRNILCAPLRIKGSIIGTVQVLNKIGGEFSVEDLYFLELLASQAGVSIEKNRLYEEATKDSLTGLNTRRFFDVLIKDEFLRAKRDKTKLSFALFDIDHFKSVNDTYGHPAGDEVLRTMSSLFQRSVGENEILARYGGEEFALIMPSTDSEQAAIFVEKIRKAVESQETFLSSRKLPKTISVGFVTWPDVPADTLEEIIKYADEALYASKANGRNRVTQYKH